MKKASNFKLIEFINVVSLAHLMIQFEHIWQVYESSILPIYKRFNS